MRLPKMKNWKRQLAAEGTAIPALSWTVRRSDIGYTKGKVMRTEAVISKDIVGGYTRPITPIVAYIT